MKLKYKFVVRQVGGRPVAVAVGKDNAHFNGMIKLNESGEFIFKMLNSGEVSQEEIISALIKEYEINQELAQNTVMEFSEYLKQNGLIEE